MCRSCLPGSCETAAIFIRIFANRSRDGLPPRTRTFPSGFGSSGPSFWTTGGPIPGGGCGPPNVMRRQPRTRNVVGSRTKPSRVSRHVSSFVPGRGWGSRFRQYAERRPRPVSPIDACGHLKLAIGEEDVWHRVRELLQNPEVSSRHAETLTGHLELALSLGEALSANITETPATFGISVGRWR